jgi:hypothetical protein
MDRREELRAHIPNIIRDGSASGRLVRAEEILAELTGKGLLKSPELEQETHLETMLKQTLLENQDIHEIPGRKGASHYYSERSMSGTYAGILALKSENPLWLIAEVVRENSRVYPSPVPLVRFREAPFDLSPAIMSECLAALRDEEEYRDIELTTTSAGTTFLYSSLHLSADYAAILAEWMDVGQADNP